MPIIFKKLTCDNEECSGALDLEGVCVECGKVVDSIEDEDE